MPITSADLTAARTAWGDALVAISEAYETGGIDAARSLASDVIDQAYNYANAPVMFKPTLSGGEQTFRTTKEGCLSYFVGHNEAYPNDGGFGIKNWRKVEFVEAAHFIEGEVGMWMGWAHFTDKDGTVVTADKTFGYKKDADGAMRIVLHHSSLPYSA